jgi:hypothetical protein
MPISTTYGIGDLFYVAKLTDIRVSMKWKKEKEFYFLVSFMDNEGLSGLEISE